jgi:hypothetical protein
MPFRDYGRWVARFFDLDQTEQYLIFCHRDTAAQLSTMVRDVGLEDRFVFRTAEMDVLEMYVIPFVPSNPPPVLDAGDLLDALNAAEKVGLKGHLFEAEMASFDNDGPYKVTFPDIERAPEDSEPGATHPEGEHEQTAGPIPL